MIQSLWKIEFITAGGTFLLLDWGDFVPSEIGPEVAQTVELTAPIGADWAKTRPQKGAVTSLTWGTRRDHTGHADLRAFVLRHAATFPTGQSGTLRLSIQDGEVWDIPDAAVATTKPAPLVPSGGFRTITSYTASGGGLRPAAAIPLFPGIAWDWILQDWDDLTDDWDTL